MSNLMFCTAAGLLVLASLLLARTLHRLHRDCPCLQHGEDCDRGLLRWYAQGFDRPVQLAKYLAAATLLVLIVGIKTRAPSLGCALAIVALGIAGMEWHFGRHHRLRHRSERRPPAPYIDPLSTRRG